MVRVDIEHAIEYLEQQIDELLKRNYITPAYEIQWRDVAIALCRAEVSRQENAPLTWNERINQMTVEEKADVAVILSKRCARALEKESCPDLTCWQCFIEFLNSPYTEGEKE